jgi:hypothetical protein
MDPDEALRQLRSAIVDWEMAEPGSRAEHNAGERATSAAGALDDWLSKGGFLPRAWNTMNGAASREVTSREVIMVPHGYHLQAQAQDGWPEGQVMRDMLDHREWVYSEGRWEDQR